MTETLASAKNRVADLVVQLYGNPVQYRFETDRTDVDDYVEAMIQASEVNTWVH